MAGTDFNAKLNQLLVNLSRSLLQYVGESWPWVRYGEEDERRWLDDLVVRQQSRLERLMELLARGNRPVDFGVYPTEYTDLHYISLDYLLLLLIEEKKALVSEVEQTRARCAGEPAAEAVLSDLLAGEQHDLQQLQELRKEHNSKSAA